MKPFPDQQAAVMSAQQQHHLQLQQLQQQQLQLQQHQQPGSMIINSYPLAMECDPPASSSSSSSLATINNRYGSHMHRGGTGIGNNNIGRYPIIGSNQIPTKSNYLNNYAPASLPIDLGLVSGNGGKKLPPIMDHPSMGGYPHSMIVGSGSSGGFHMNQSSYALQDASTTAMQMTHQNSKSSSSSSSATQNGRNTDNDRDESPMVGVCVQQSPVAIH